MSYFQIKKIFSELENLVVIWNLEGKEGKSRCTLQQSLKVNSIFHQIHPDPPLTWVITRKRGSCILFSCICFCNFVAFWVISFGVWFHSAFSTTIFSFCVISVGFLLFSFLIYEHLVHEGTSLRRTHQRPMESHRNLLSNHRNDKSIGW